MLGASTATILDGAAVARRIRSRARAEVEGLGGIAKPSLRIFLIGDNPASLAYVSGKSRAAEEVGIRAETRNLPPDVSEADLLAELGRTNADRDVHGILIQLPLPKALDASRVLDAVAPLKDVDGFHPDNVGRLHQGRPRFVPCTPAGVMELLDVYEIALAGRRAVVLGRSDIVGKPMAALLTARDATVTLCHSKTRHLPAVCREADVLVAAIGRPGFVTREFVRPGAAVIDVGINRLTSLEGAPEGLRRSERLRAALARKGQALVGDVDFDDVSSVAGWITPVPGGVGPLTVAMLMANTVKAMRLQA